MTKKAKRRKEPWTPPERKAPDAVWEMPDGHHLGYTNGFHKRGDELHLAPAHTATAEAIRLDRAALDDYVDAVNRHLHNELRKIRRREDAWWQYVEKDIGIKRTDVSYFYAGYVKRRSPEPVGNKESVK